jgi:hypothetical protein
MVVYVQYQSRCITSYREPVEFGEWGDSNTFDIKGVALSSRKSWNGLAYLDDEFTVDFDVAPGDMVYVLSMIYSTGDTFGRSDGNGEILWVFKDRARAMAAREVWAKACQENYVYSVQFETDSGTTATMHNPAAGYFEQLQDLNLDIFLVQP